MSALLLLFLFSLQSVPSAIVCTVTAGGAPVAGAEIVVAGKTYVTDPRGEVRIDVDPGSVELTVVKDGFAAGDGDGDRRGGTAAAGDDRARTAAVGPGDRHRFRDPHRPRARGSADARRGPRPRGDRREADDDARRRRHDAERNGRHARAGDVAVARCGERAHSGDARPLHAVPVGRAAALRRTGRRSA